MSDRPVLATGALTACQVNSERLDIIWIREDGRLEAVTRGSGTHEAPYSRAVYGKYETLCIPGNAVIHGGGSLAAVANLQGCGESVMWYVESEHPNRRTGSIGPARWKKGEDKWGYSGAKSAGSVAKAGRRMSELQAWSVQLNHMYGNASCDLLWIGPAGMLQVARLWLDVPYRPIPSDVIHAENAVPDAHASIDSGICVYVRCCEVEIEGEVDDGTEKEKRRVRVEADVQFAFWVSDDGGVWGTYSLPSPT